ncbi:ParB/RepB/Spo0J family partition protein [Streptomyces malaysiensis]|uniref:ParB/RepB/Spo0J family partition protein n=1 Tax=Streptomyces malaysiensis subsp. samsunensis TaxID=459658 RepID=A0A9X2M2B4_STRMQ|nr:ParB/RepB/Spo0J family partition protein [Streptomyces samsunensis]MCQ8833796.1 ParB/RepB/Spo0J family partition protein [Streptomyces samsunensis]
MAGAQNSLSVAERRAQREAERRAEQGRQRAEAEQRAAGSGFEVAIEELANNPRNAREQLEGLEGLASTYESVGLLQPVAAIPAEVFKAAFPENADEIGDARFVVIGGNRRLAAARLAGLEKLPVLVNRKATTRKNILVAAATENLSREELKPFEELATIEELKKEFGTYEAVAKVLGKSGGWVSQRRRLHNLQPEVRQALEERIPGMTIELARDLGTIKDRDEQLAAWEQERALAAARDAEPKPDKGRKQGGASKKAAKKPVPKQGGAGGDELDEATKARREACLATVLDFTEDASRLHIIALQASTDPDEAVALASQWLGEAGIGASALSLPSLPGDEGKGRQARAALALSLAHCEIHMVRNGGNDAAHASAYLDWLGTHTDYEQADDAESALTA